MSADAPHPARNVPDGWIELTAQFVDEVKLGVHAGWLYGDLGDGGEFVFHVPADGGAPRAWAVRRNRVLGSPIEERPRREMFDGSSSPYTIAGPPPRRPLR